MFTGDFDTNIIASHGIVLNKYLPASIDINTTRWRIITFVTGIANDAIARDRIADDIASSGIVVIGLCYSFKTNDVDTNIIVVIDLVMIHFKVSYITIEYDRFTTT